MPNLGAIKVPDCYKGASSGPIALALAAMDGHQRIYMLGFDLGPAENGMFNNMYADTDFYKKSTASATYTGNWKRQICRIAQDFPQCEIVRVAGNTTADIAEFDACVNMQKLLFDNFVERINTKKDL